MTREELAAIRATPSEDLANDMTVLTQASALDTLLHLVITQA
jgi:hypothetical protein